jgi:hypothetical protein
MINVPLASLPSQVLSIALGGQSCRLKVYARSTGMFIDVYVDDALILGGAPLRNGTLVFRDAYLGFVGDLMVLDTTGTSDPFYSASAPSIGDRFVLIYLEAADLAVTA